MILFCRSDTLTFCGSLARPPPRLRHTFEVGQTDASPDRTLTNISNLDLVNVVFSVILEKDSTHEDNVKDLTAFANVSALESTRVNPALKSYPFQRPNPVKVKEQDDDFTKLQNDVTEFVTKFSSFAEAEGAKLASQITALTSEITALKKELVE